MARRCVVRVPASSANLGPGFDAFAAALPGTVPMADAVHNVARASMLVLGLALVIRASSPPAPRVPVP